MNRYAWTGMHEPAFMLLLQLLLLLHACVRGCPRDRHHVYTYQLIYSSAQTRAWRIDFSHRNIHVYKGRLKGRVRVQTSGYCRVDRDGTGASDPRGGYARDFVNFRKKIHVSRARGAAGRV
jgi:hypothetical protein